MKRNEMKQIYTRTGDTGLTSLRGGIRVEKESIRIETNGCLDELNALLGVVRSLAPAESELAKSLQGIQRELMVIMSHVATPEGEVNPKPLRTDGWIEQFEQQIDALTATDRPVGFVLPGGTPLAAHLHWARTIARRAERRLWKLHRESPLDSSILRFMNRLSDWLFAEALYGSERKEEWL